MHRKRYALLAPGFQVPIWARVDDMVFREVNSRILFAVECPDEECFNAVVKFASIGLCSNDNAPLTFGAWLNSLHDLFQAMQKEKKLMQQKLNKYELRDSASRILEAFELDGRA